MNEIKEQNIDTETSEFKKFYSLNSDSFNDIKGDKNLNLMKKNSEESEELSKKDSLSSLNISNIDIPQINMPNSDYKNSNNIKEGIWKSKTDFIIRKYSSSNENNRYDNMNDIYNDNLKFFSFVKDDYNDEDDDIVNNEITSRYNNEEKNNNKEEINQLDSYELKTENINIYSNNNKSIDSKKDKNEIKNLNNGIQNIKKENEKENLINNLNNIKNMDISINVKKDLINNDIFDSSDITIKKKIKENDNILQSKTIDNTVQMNKQRGIKFLNLTKQKKIFQKFLSVSVDTSCLYSLEDDMTILILNPKINYNFPFNKKERELE